MFWCHIWQQCSGRFFWSCSVHSLMCCPYFRDNSYLEWRWDCSFGGSLQCRGDKKDFTDTFIWEGRGAHFNSEPIWEVPECWAGVQDRRHRFHAHRAVLQNQILRILILLQPDQLKVLLANPPHLEFCPLSHFLVLGSAGSSEQGTQSLARPTQVQLVVLNFNYEAKVWSSVWSSVRNEFHSGDCHPSLTDPGPQTNQHCALGQCSLWRTRVPCVYLPFWKGCH